LFPIVLVAGMFVCAAASSSGEAILFQDDFENGAVGSSPVAEAGSWSFLSTGGVVQDANPPGAAGGSKYMSVSRSGWSQANSDFASQPVGTQLTLGVDVWGDPTASANPLIYATDHDGGNDAFYLSFAQDGKVKSNAGNEFDWLPNAWNHVEINYVVGASTWGFTFNGTLSDSDLPMLGTYNGTVTALGLAAGNSNAVYFDNVKVTTPIPEPMSMGLLATGAAGILAYAWRRRR
jgi:hypothetical protein